MKVTSLDLDILWGAQTSGCVNDDVSDITVTQRHLDPEGSNRMSS